MWFGLKRLFFLSFFLFLLFIVFANRTFAASNFTADYDVTYAIQNSGNTHSVFNITLTNTTSQYYASSYKVVLGFNDIENLKAQDDGGPITPISSNTANGKTIELKFNKPVVGVGNKLNFSITFDTADIAQNEKNIWEVNIPGIAAQNDFASFNVHVLTPQSLGSPTIIKPYYPQAITGTHTLFFNKDELGKSGISLTFGDKQTYNFALVYHLQNPNLFPVQTDIAIPPQTNYQQVILSSLSPKPQNVRVDTDGNWLATYNLNPSQKLDVTADETIQVGLVPNKQLLTTQQENIYLQQQPYWQVNDAKIQQLAKNLKTPENIYNYVVSTLSYNFTKVNQNQNRLGAAGVLQNPTDAVCLEFTDLFVTLSRAAGIPAREVDGFAYTRNAKDRPLSLVQDILHAWPEYYDKDQQIWVMVDPTWGNTTGGMDYFHDLDFDHVAFVIKGENSSYPVPAGGYKYNGSQNTKDVNMQFGSTFGMITPDVSLSPDFPTLALSSLPISGQILVQNSGKVIVDNAVITVSNDKLFPKLQNLTVADLPPFGHVILPVSFDKTSFLTNTVAVVTISLSATRVSQTIRIAPFFVNEQTFIGGGIIASFVIIILIIALKSRNLFVSKQK